MSGIWLQVDPLAFALAIAGIIIGGIVKGATGAGAPIIAVPMLALAFDVPTAVTLFTVPNLISNIWQAWHYRGHHISRRFTATFAIACCIGAGLGTVVLVSLPPDALSLGVALGCIAYIGFRLAQPEWTLARASAERALAPVGLAAGVLQGAVGVSAPITLSFLNAMKLDRPVFIATVSVVFIAMSLGQIPVLTGTGLMTLPRLLGGVGVLVLILATMPIGAALARRWSAEVFNKIILGMLAVISLRLLVEAI